jgi:PPOX class probable F420-dependent enzyme
MTDREAAFEPWQMALIAELRVARMATIAADGSPQQVPVCYALVDGAFVIAIDEKPKSGRPLGRLRNIERDCRVGLLFDRYDEDWRLLAWVRVDGEASLLTAGAEWPVALAALRGRYAQYETMALEGRPLIVVRPQRVTSWRWRA